MQLKKLGTLDQSRKFRNCSSTPGLCLHIFGFQLGGCPSLRLTVFSELFADSTTKNSKSIEFLTVATRGLGMQSADLNYVVAEATKNGEHYFETLTRIKTSLDVVSSEFGVNRKRLSVNFFELRKDITQFGHLTDIQ